jgi:zinc and cadmium transporter
MLPEIIATLAVYCVLIMGASVLGGWIPMFIQLTHRRMEIALSFISGVMVGVAVLVLLPHALAARMQAAPIHEGDAHVVAHHLLSPMMISLLAGFLAMFLIERFFCFHHHDAPSEAGVKHQHHHDHAEPHVHTVRWSGAAVGLTLHSLLDGVALAASVAAIDHVHDGHSHDIEAKHSLFAGLGAFVVIFLHKPFDSLTLGTLMAAGNHSRAARWLVNILFAALVPVGAGLFMLGLSAGHSQSSVLSIALAFAAGTFLCIALSDLLPELQFHHHDRLKLSIALLLGLAVAWGIAALEAGVHEH